MSSSQASRVLLRYFIALIFLLLAAAFSPGRVLAAAPLAHPAASAAGAEITITADGFAPATITVTVGAEVTWRNLSGVTVQLSDEPFPDEQSGDSIYLPQLSTRDSGVQAQQKVTLPAATNWVSEPIAPDGVFTQTFVGSGTYQYFASHAPGVVATVVVQPETFVEPIIPETTEVLSEATTEHLASVSAGGDVFTFTQSTAELAELTSGDIMVGDVSEAAPYGFLRRVVSVEQDDGQVVVTTEPATLEDAIQQGSLQISKRFTPADIQGVSMASGVALVWASGTQLEDSFYFEVKDVVLYDDDGNLSTTSDQLKANGSFELAPGIDFNLRVSDWTLQELEFVFEVDEKVELEFVVEVERKVERKYEIARLNLGSVDISPKPNEGSDEV